jgi:hypothetical protein
MISELGSMWKEEAAWCFPVGIHKNRVSRSSYRFFKLGNFEYEEGMLTTRPSWNIVLNGVRRWVYPWRGSFDTGNCVAWNRMGHKEEFYMRPIRLAWITYELKLHQHMLFEIQPVVLTCTFKGLLVKSVLRSLYDSTHRFLHCLISLCLISSWNLVKHGSNPRT